VIFTLVTFRLPSPLGDVAATAFVKSRAVSWIGSAPPLSYPSVTLIRNFLPLASLFFSELALRKVLMTFFSLERSSTRFELTEASLSFVSDVLKLVFANPSSLLGVDAMGSSSC